MATAFSKRTSNLLRIYISPSNPQTRHAGKNGIEAQTRHEKKSKTNGVMLKKKTQSKAKQSKHSSSSSYTQVLLPQTFVWMEADLS